MIVLDYRDSRPLYDIRSKRFLIVLGLILLTSCASIYGALTGLSDAVAWCRRTAEGP